MPTINTQPRINASEQLELAPLGQVYALLSNPLTGKYSSQPFTASSGGSVVYDVGGGCTVKATAVGVTFSRSLNIYTFTIPATVRIDGFKIYNTAIQFPGTSIQLNFNYTSNATTNQSLVTANPPTINLWDMTPGLGQTVFTTGSGSSQAFRPKVESASSGSIVITGLLPTGFTEGESLITGQFNV
jgi:hypothetical protein